MKGDLNDDGQVNALDLTALELYIVGRYACPPTLTPEELFWRADVNGDGAVNALDLTALEILIAGPPLLFGQIVQSEIIVGGQRLPMGSQVSLGDTLAASLEVQNQSSIAIEMGVHWQLLDPSSTGPYTGVKQVYNSPIPGPAVQPYGSHVFDGPALTVDVEGTWAIYAELYGRVSGGAWEMLNSIYQPLCVVAAVLLAGRISRKELDYDAVRVPFPVQ